MTLNREIAEKVMEWKLVEETHDYHFKIGCIQPIETLWWKNKNGNIMWRCEDWHPETDIKQAFEVVEKLFEKFDQIDLRMRKDDTTYLVLWNNHEKIVAPIAHELNLGQITPKMAICLAALKVLEEQE